VDGSINDTAKELTTLVDDDIPLSMALSIANYTMAMFAGHFHWKIKLAEDNIVPANALFFILAKSGAKKTSTVITMEKAIASGLHVINEKRWEVAKEVAKANFKPTGDDEADEAMLESLLIPPVSLDSAISTEQGLFQKLNWFERDKIGMPSLYIDEISTELASNADIVPNIKIIAQLFDNGEMKAKTLKDTKMQLRDIVSMGMNGMFIGSEHGILEDESVLKKFLTEFISKLARRVFFGYPVFDFEEDDVEDFDDILGGNDEVVEQRKKTKKQINELSEFLAKKWINSTKHNHIEMTEETRIAHLAYMKYCKYLSDDLDVEAENLEQQHRHWKVLKLASIYAVWNQHDMIELKDFKEAVTIAEISGDDIGTFLEKANRETYEIMSDHMEMHDKPMTVHEMVKKGWAKKEADVRNMVLLANSKQKDKGKFEIDESTVTYTRFQKAEDIGASFIMVSGTKEQRATKTFDGYQYKRNPFEKLGILLSNDTAYCAFEFRNGKRSKENIISGADFIVLDVDDSDITDTEASDMLGDYNHLIARTSSNNPYKFRVLIPTDITVQLSNEKWKPFMKKVQEHLGIEIDLLPKSQIYYGYKDREVISNFGAMDLEASELVKNIEVPKKVVKTITTSSGLTKAWESRLTTFRYAYECPSGKGLHLAFFRAMKHAFDLGFSIEMNRELFEDILDYNDDADELRDSFVESLEAQRLATYGQVD